MPLFFQYISPLFEIITLLFVFFFTKDDFVDDFPFVYALVLLFNAYLFDSDLKLTIQRPTKKTKGFFVPS